MTKIRSQPSVDFHSLINQPGGMPPKEKMTNPTLKTSVTKASVAGGLSFFNGISKEKTWKTDGNKDKIAKNWRNYDLPPNKLNPMSEQHFKAMMGRMEKRHQSLIPDAAMRVIQQTESRIQHVSQERTAELEDKLADAFGQFRAESEMSTDAEDIMMQMHQLRETIGSELADVQRELDDMAAAPDYRAAKKDAGIPMEKLRAKADNALNELAGDIAGAEAKTQYAQAREELLGASLNKFLDAYCTLREHDADEARATALATILPAMARQLEQPAKYLEGIKAVEIAKDMLKADGLTGEEIQREMPAIQDALVGRRVRDLTAGRTSEMPGKPPTEQEAAQWKADAAALRNLAADYARIADIHKETTPALKERAKTMQGQCMLDLVAHLPSMDKMSEQQREDTGIALAKLAHKLLLTSGDSLHKDAPMAPFHLMHIISMAEAVTNGDPERSIDIYRALTRDHAHTAIDGHIDRLDKHAPASQTESDMVRMWQLGAHQLPDTVGSLLAANPNNKGVDWRDVQTFWRCAKEHERLGEVKDGDITHMERMKAAMRALRDELVEGKTPEPGTAERRHWAMAKSAVWEQGTLRHVEKVLEEFPSIASLPGTTVEMAHDRFKQKGRGDVQGDARARFKEVLRNLKGFAQDSLNNAGTPRQREAAGALLAMSDFMDRHRGSEKAMTRLQRKFTGKEATFNAGREIWSNNLGAKEKKAILAEAAKFHATQPSDSSAPAANLPFLNKLDSGHGALDLLKEALSAMGDEAAGMMKEVHSLEDAVKLAQGGKLEGPEAIRRFLHDAIDRTELGDRMDTLNAQQFKIAVPIAIPLPVGALTHSVCTSNSSGVIVNVQANNDCVQLTLGEMSEHSFGNSVGFGVGDEVLPEQARQALGKTPLDVRLPGIALKRDDKTRTDPAVVLKYSIEPKDGLRDLTEAREAMKKAVDLMAEWKPGEMLDSHGRPYASVFEAMCDRLDPPPTIDDELRQYKTTSYEGTLNFGRLAAKLGNAGHARAGFAATLKVTRNNDVMESVNQQGARERYEVTKQTLKGDLLFGVNTSRTTIKSEEETKELTASGEKKKVTKSLFGFPVNLGMSGTVEANIGGRETKYKFPVGTDKYKAYKLEYGDYSRDMEQAIDMFLETLPPVAARVQEVVNKGFRKQMEQRLAGKVEEKLGRELREGTLQESDTGTRRTQLRKELVDKELGKMEAEVMLNFARALKEEKTDRFSYKLESRQQWAHRGIDAAILNAEEAGDVAMANLMREVEARVFEGDKDQAVKYLVAAGDSGIKRSQMNWTAPLTTKRREAKSMKEDPLPDTRTATLVPTADRLIEERLPENPMTDLQKRIVKASLAQVRGEDARPQGRQDLEDSRHGVPEVPRPAEHRLARWDSQSERAFRALDRLGRRDAQSERIPRAPETASDAAGRLLSRESDTSSLLNVSRRSDTRAGEYPSSDDEAIPALSPVREEKLKKAKI